MEDRLAHKIEQEVGDLSGQIVTLSQKLDGKTDKAESAAHEIRIKTIEEKVFPN